MRAISTCFSQSATRDYVAMSSYYCESVKRWMPATAATVLCVWLSACSGDTPNDTPDSETRSQAAQSTTTQPATTQSTDTQSTDTQSTDTQTSVKTGAAGGTETATTLSTTDATLNATLSTTPDEGLTDSPRILVFGDSISAAYGIKRDDGWVALLQQRLSEVYANAKVVNASVSGETTQGGRARLQASLDRHSPDLVFLELGGNDALRGYPVERLRENLIAMVTQAQAAGAKVVLLGMQIPPNYGPKYTRDFAQAFNTVADASDAYLVPFFLEGVALVEGMIQSDGIHPTTKAQPLLLETSWQALATVLGDNYPKLR